MSVLDDIRDRLDIVDVISAYVPLKKAGRSYKGLCPFHTEKTPSFIVFPESQHWRCFGACSTGGDIFSFVMKRENLDFGEALTLLAGRAGVELKPKTEVASAEENRLDRLRAILADTAAYYHYLLNNAKEAAFARDYLVQRSLTLETWETWQLGYSLDSWDALSSRLTAKGYQIAEIESAGLIIARENQTGHYDRFRGRLMIPIRDVQGRTIGFGARVLREDPDHPSPKYMNSPQSPLFDKSSVLFGLDVARKAIRDADQAVLVEGYMDVLGSHQAGVANVVAGMGTALTETQMRLIRRYTNNVTLALDPDVAGDHATLRGLEAARTSLEREVQPVMSRSGLVRHESRLKAQLRIASLPDGKDPDELALSDVERWRRVIADAQPVVDYYLSLVKREEDLASARGKANAVERMAPLIAEISDNVERRHYVQALARLLESDEMLVENRVAAAAKAGGRAMARSEPGPEPAPPQTRGVSRGRAGRGEPVEVMEEHVLGFLLARPELCSRLDAELAAEGSPGIAADDFLGEESRSLLNSLQALGATASWRELSPAERLESLPEPLRARATELQESSWRQPSMTEETLVRDAARTVLRLREHTLRRQIKHLETLIQDGDEGGLREDTEAFRRLINVYSLEAGRLHKLLEARTMAGALAKAKAGQKAAA